MEPARAWIGLSNALDTPVAKVAVIFPQWVAKATGKAERTVEAETVREALQKAVEGNKWLAKQIFADKDRLQLGVVVFLGQHDIRHLNGLDTRIEVDATIAVALPLLIGGEPTERLPSDERQ